MDIQLALALIMCFWWFATGFDFFVVSKLVDYERRNHHSQWVADGSPSGLYQESHAAAEWIKSAPDWIKKSEYASSLLWYHRLWTKSTVVVMLALVIGFIYEKIADFF